MEGLFGKQPKKDNAEVKKAVVKAKPKVPSQRFPHRENWSLECHSRDVAIVQFTNVLDGKRYNAVAFMMAKLPKANELAAAVMAVDDNALTREGRPPFTSRLLMCGAQHRLMRAGVNQLVANMGTPEEVRAIKEADTSEAPLDRPEQFVLEVC